MYNKIKNIMSSNHNVILLILLILPRAEVQHDLDIVRLEYDSDLLRSTVKAILCSGEKIR